MTQAGKLAKKKKTKENKRKQKLESKEGFSS
jgi:hypothetical protein